MLDTIGKLYDLLSPRERRQAVLVFLMMVSSAFLEVIGVASVMPFVAVLADPSVIETNDILSWLFESMEFSNTRDFFIFLGGSLLLVFLVSLSFRAATIYAIQKFSTMRIHTLAVKMLNIYMSQSYEFMLGKNSSSLAKAILVEVSNVANGVLLPSMRAVSGIIVSAAIVALLIAVQPITSITLAGVLGGCYLIMYRATRPLVTRAGKARLEANESRFLIAGEALQGFKELRLLGREFNYVGKFVSPSREYARQEAQTLIVRELPYFLIQGLAFGGVILLLLILVAGGQRLEAILPIVAFYAFAGYRILPAFQDVYRSFGQLRFYLPSLYELHDHLNLDRYGVHRAGSPQSRLELKKALSFDEVSFRYTAASGNAVRGLDFEIAAGSRVALVGHTGAGKTTAVDLLLGLLTPTEGQILIDGVPLTQDNMREWQASLGYVPQSIFLADDTIAANIAFGVDPSEIDLSEVRRAAQVAQIDDFITTELADGYQTRIGERGARLSGGQRQRLGIARALYHKPQVLVLDEATSALDNATERRVMKALENSIDQVTLILIAHRLSTVKTCDEIFFFEAGRIRAAGTYEELLAGSDGFRKLVSTPGTETMEDVLQ